MKTKKSDFSAIITLAKSKVTGYMYVLDADIERRHPDRIITDILEKERWLKRDFGRGYKKSGAETVQFQWFLKEELAKASARAGLYLPIEEVPQTSDKTMRIQTMQPDVKNHYIKFNKSINGLLNRCSTFRWALTMMARCPGRLPDNRQEKQAVPDHGQESGWIVKEAVYYAGYLYGQGFCRKPDRKKIFGRS